MTETILFVDDDIQLVSALQRSFHRTYRVELALNASDALKALAETPYAVVVSDLQMPGMNGIDLLTRVKVQSPDTVRILLTGQADLEAAIESVNEGNVFRFLRKPCPQELLKKTLDAALIQFRLHIAERTVLQETLVGTVAVLTELLATVAPAAFGRASRLCWCVQKIGHELKVKDPWQFEAAAMLSQIGCVPMPSEALRRHFGEEIPAPAENGANSSHARVARRILERIPRLGVVAQIIGRQHEPYETVLHHSPEQYRIALGAQLLRVAIDFDRAVNQGRSFAEALTELRNDAADYNPEILNALGKVIGEASKLEADSGAPAGGSLTPPAESRPAWANEQGLA
ncbi:MAG TPA: HD domain-containing phosphohydrolase [Bryobacteraceae bacterium]|nr:HD domain-containing phosphohydrolase [Bryobacteraceae bacterium]